MVAKSGTLDSPLSALDARVRLFLSLITSVSIILPLKCLLILAAGLTAVLVWGRFLKIVFTYFKKFFWIILILISTNALLVSTEFALILGFRFLLLVFSFTIFTETTSMDEIYSILRWLKCPYALSFSFSVAFRFLPIFQQEWQIVKEAQLSRGIRWQKPKSRSVRQLFISLQSTLPFIIPVIVLTVKRAWNLTEAAYLRGIDQPLEEKFASPSLKKRDYAFLINLGALYTVLMVVLCK